MINTDSSNPIRLREYEKLPYSRISETGVRRLEQITKDLGIPLFHFSRTHAQAQQYVGVIEAGDTTIQILPKVFDHDEENLGYLVFLLSYTRRLKLRSAGVAQYEKLQGSFLEIWIRHFALELNRLLRTQWKHRYVEVEERVTFLRGKLLVERELAGTEKFSGRYACRYEVFTPDHLLNRVLKFCNYLLLQQTRVSANRSILRENDILLSDVAYRPIRLVDLDGVHLDRLNRDYEPMLDLCRLLLERSTLDLRAGRIAQLAFVFDMNRLFEEFVAEFLRRHKDKVQLENGRQLIEVDYQHPLGRLFGAFNMYVDLMLTDDTGRRFLVDTKYKRLDAAERHAGLDQDDFYQMFAYGRAGRRLYDEVLLLYPMTDVVRRTYRQDNLTLHIRQFDSRAIYDPKCGRLAISGAAAELSRALSV